MQDTNLPRPSRRRGVYSALIALLVIGTLIATAFLVALLRDIIAVRHIPVPELPASGPITIAFTGDTTLLRAASPSDASYVAVANIVRRATLGFTNLEMSLPNPAGSLEKPPMAGPLTRLGPADGATIVRSLGFDIVSLANDHTMDLGDAGFRSTTGALDVAGVLHAGAGRDLSKARTPAMVGQGSRHVAVIAIVWPAERDAVLDAIRQARQQASIVVLSVHDDDAAVNRRDDPDNALTRLAHDAVDAGASIVVGHGPHRIRGVEMYKGHPIFYSLGHFAYDAEHAAIEGPGAAAADEWWEGLVATARFEGADLAAVDVVPLDLAGSGAGGIKGIPALGAGERGQAILRRFSTLSAAFGTGVQIDGQGLTARVPIYEKR